MVVSFLPINRDSRIRRTGTVTPLVMLSRAARASGLVPDRSPGPSQSWCSHSDRHGAAAAVMPQAYRDLAANL
jgi:hypothetical protein